MKNQTERTTSREQNVPGDKNLLQNCKEELKLLEQKKKCLERI